jgi:hypothetical protein
VFRSSTVARTVGLAEFHETAPIPATAGGTSAIKDPDRLAAARERLSQRIVQRATSLGSGAGTARGGVTQRQITADSSYSESKTALDTNIPDSARQIGLPSPPKDKLLPGGGLRALSEDNADVDGLEEFSSDIATLLKPLIVHGELTEVTAPAPSFEDRYAPWPDGIAKPQQELVAQALDADAHAPPALLQLTESAEALSLRRAGIFSSVGAADAAAAAADGVHRGRPLPISRGNARRVARRALREWHASLLRSAPPGAPPLPLPVDAAAQSAAVRALLPPPPMPSPLEQTCARLTVGQRNRKAAASGLLPCAIGLASATGAKPASRLPPERLAHLDFGEGPLDTAPPAPVGKAAKAVSDDPSLLIRVMRPLGGDGNAGALSSTGEG